MPIYLTPGVYYETVDVARPGLAAVRTDIAAFVGVAERGPLHTPTIVNSWEQFQSVFGTFIPNAYLAYAVKAFFENGGQTCYIVRVAVPPAATQTAASVEQPSDGSASLVASIDGFAPGAVVTVSQAPSARDDYLLRDVDRANRRLIWQRPLGAPLVLNAPGRPLLFETGCSTAGGEILDASGVATLRVEASSPGAWGNRLAVRVSHISPAATRTRREPQPDDRSAARVESVTGFPVGSLVKIFQDRSPLPLVSYRIVVAVDSIRRQLTWDRPLDLPYDMAQPIAVETLEFSLTVSLDGRPQELHSGLSLVARHPRYVEPAINAGGSQLIRVGDLAPATPWPDRLPDPGAANLTRGQLRLRGGRDGIATLRPEDITGDQGAPERWGLRALEQMDDVAIVAVPDIMIQPRPAVETAPQPERPPNPCLPGQRPSPPAEPPPPQAIERARGFSLEEIYAVQQALVEQCESRRDRIALLDPPVLPGATEAVDIETIQSWRMRFDTRYAALYYPWVLVYDPLQIDGQALRTLPPSGHVAGIFARIDLADGVHRAPANAELKWAQALSADVVAEMQGLLNPQGINCIRSFPGRGLRLYGARTLSSDPDWRYVNVRRLMMMIEKAVGIAIQWSVFEPNNAVLRQMLALTITSFLKQLWAHGALAGATPDDAFFVTCDASNNPRGMADLGQLLAEVGVAPTSPAEFVVFRIGRTEDALRIAE